MPKRKQPPKSDPKLSKKPKKPKPKPKKFKLEFSKNELAEMELPLRWHHVEKRIQIFLDKSSDFYVMRLFDKHGEVAYQHGVSYHDLQAHKNIPRDLFKHVSDQLHYGGHSIDVGSLTPQDVARVEDQMFIIAKLAKESDTIDLPSEIMNALIDS
jgi:hypothetical protein